MISSIINLPDTRPGIEASSKDRSPAILSVFVWHFSGSLVAFDKTHINYEIVRMMFLPPGL